MPDEDGLDPELVVCVLFTLVLGGVLALAKGERGQVATILAVFLVLSGVAFMLQRWVGMTKGEDGAPTTIAEGTMALVIGGVMTALGAAILLT